MNTVPERATDIHLYFVLVHNFQVTKFHCLDHSGYEQIQKSYKCDSHYLELFEASKAK